MGVLHQPDTQPYDHYRHYGIVDAGKRTTKVTATSVTFTQTLSSGGIAYIYEKTLRLVPGKPELVIEHRAEEHRLKADQHDGLRPQLPETGARQCRRSRDISLPGRRRQSAACRSDAHPGQHPHLSAAHEEQGAHFFPDHRLRQHAKDYDFRVEDTATSAGVRIQGDQPITRLNIFSIDKVQSVEPYIAIKLAPGQEKHWRYTYGFNAP